MPSTQPSAALAITTAHGGTRQNTSATNATSAAARSRGAAIVSVPDGMIERGEQQPDDGRVHARERRLHACAAAQALPERRGAGNEQERRCEDRDECDRAAEPAVRRIAQRSAEECREREQRPRHGLREPVAGEERRIADPAGRDHGRLQQRQHHVPAAEHERARAEERIDDGQRIGAEHACRERQRDKQRREQREPQHARAVRYVQRQRLVGVARRLRQQDEAGGTGRDDHRNLRPCGRREQRDARGRGHQRDAARIRAQRARHAPDGLRDHRDRYDAKPVQRTGFDRCARCVNAEREQHHQQRGRHREAEPGGEHPGIAGAREADRHPDLAARGPRQELAQPDEIRIRALGEPAAPRDEFGAEVAEMRDRAAERREAEPQECDEHGPWMAGGGGGGRCVQDGARDGRSEPTR